MTTGKVLGERHKRWLEEKRKLSCDTIVKFGIYTGRAHERGEVIPDAAGNVLVFPFLERDQIVNEKYRAPEKKFWQRSGGRRTFWNSDILDDPGVAEGREALIITEGEIDALTAIDNGFPFTVSVPDGAPAVAEGEDPEELKPIDSEDKGKFEFLWNNRERLKNIRRFIIAVDNDLPGKRLAAELVRRLSASRCWFVAYPEGCKDLNDVLVRHGPEAVADVLNGAKPYPVRGLYQLLDYPAREPLRTFRTGWWTMDQNLRLWLGEFMMVTGIPGHGKSAWVNNLLFNLAQAYGWRAALFSPEEPTVPQLRDKFRRLYLDRTPTQSEYGPISEADSWINDHFVFIDADPTGKIDDDYDLDWVLERGTDAVLRHGIQALVIDPWNEIEHAKRRDESMTEYHGRAIRAVKRFGQQYNVATIVVAHPTKEVGRDGKSRPPTPYDTDGSAHFFNKADHFVIVHRPDESLDESHIRIAKVKFEGTGEKGMVRMKFDRASGRFGTMDGSHGAAGEPDQMVAA
jgi:twinkle protein